MLNETQVRNLIVDSYRALYLLKLPPIVYTKLSKYARVLTLWARIEALFDVLGSREKYDSLKIEAFNSFASKTREKLEDLYPNTRPEDLI
ncbi:hypothetical protein [Myxosarcina sp. GI1(2024)]